MPPTPEQTKTRPGSNGHGLGITLPVAPQALARIRFTPEEKTPAALTPREALARLDARLAAGDAIDTVEISGPGDPLATMDRTLETLDLVREKYPKLTLTVTTLGIHGDQQVKALAAHGVSRLTLLVEGVDPEVLQRVYAWIRPAKRTVPLAQAAETLLSEQATCLAACKQAGIAATIRATVFPEANDTHIEAIARETAAMGATEMVILPGLPVIAGERTIPAPPLELMQILRGLAGQHLPMAEAPAAAAPSMDAAGMPPSLAPRPSPERPNVAVVSQGGVEVDLHLGQASRVLIYGPREDGLISLLHTRPMPATGGGTSRWQQLAATLADCFCLLAASAGDNPRAVLQDHGISLLITTGEIESTVDHLYSGGKKGKCGKG